MYTVGVHFLNRRRPFVVAITAICIASAAGIAYANRPLPDVVVLRTETGFSPSRISVRSGQAIVFKTVEGKPFWPASNAHPSHGLYPEFDPTHQISPEASWRFVFTKPGVWGFHDHMDENIRGTVTVVGRPGESAESCFKNAPTNSPNGKTECFAADLTEALNTNGLEAAFDRFAEIYADTPSFRGLSCHDVGHILGAAAYKQYEADHTVIDRPETAYCGYGFYHGFIETMLLEKGPVYEEVRGYCDALKTDGVLNNPSGACYHGIGHAAFDSLSAEMWGDAALMVRTSVETCERAATGEAEQAQCTTGVYNSLAIAESSHVYNLSFPTKPDMSICEAQKAAYRTGCFREYGIGTIREFKLDRAATVRLIRSYGNTEAAAAMLGAYAADETSRSINELDLPSLVTFCKTFPLQMRLACDRGVESGLRQAGSPGREYETMFEYCALHERGEARTTCFTFAISQSRSIAADTAAFQKACLAIDEPSVASTCR